MMQQLGRFLIVAGVFLVILGAFLWLLGGRTGWFSWFGHLPGDIRIRKEHFFLFFPVTSMVVVSVVLSFLLWLFGRLFR